MRNQKCCADPTVKRIIKTYLPNEHKVTTNEFASNEKSTLTEIKKDLDNRGYRFIYETTGVKTYSNVSAKSLLKIQTISTNQQKIPNGSYLVQITTL